MTELINKSNHKFTDIGTERYREYHYPDGTNLHINWPSQLSVSESGGHRLMDLTGKCYYIPTGWRYITWVPIEGQSHFVK